MMRRCGEGKDKDSHGFIDNPTDTDVREMVYFSLPWTWVLREAETLTCFSSRHVKYCTNKYSRGDISFVVINGVTTLGRRRSTVNSEGGILFYRPLPLCSAFKQQADSAYKESTWLPHSDLLETPGGWSWRYCKVSHVKICRWSLFLLC